MIIDSNDLQLENVTFEASYHIPVTEWAELDPKSGFIFSIDQTGRREFDQNEIRFRLRWKDIKDETHFGILLFSVVATQIKDINGNLVFTLDDATYRKAIARLYGVTRSAYESGLECTEGESDLLNFFCAGWRLVALTDTCTDKDVMIKVNEGGSDGL